MASLIIETSTSSETEKDKSISSTTTMIHSLPIPNPKPKLLTYHDLPPWLQDNIYILTSYRPPLGHTSACIFSLFYIHNETVNIYTHLIPSTIYLLLQQTLYYFISTNYPSASLGDHLIFAFFLATATICLGFSAGFHMLCNHSEKVAGLWLRLDFAGIVVMALGVFGTSVHLGWYYFGGIQMIYWGVMLALATLSLIILILPVFQHQKWRTYRTALFFGIFMFLFIPFIHGIAKFGFWQMHRQSGLLNSLGSGGSAGLGAVFYIKRWPERFYPGRFDIIGNSHQTFHVMVVIGMVLPLVGILRAYDWNYSSRDCALR